MKTNTLMFAGILLLFMAIPINSKSETKDTSKIDIFEMSIEELINQKVTIATKSNQRLNEAPSIVSVITTEEIKNMGARELADVLQTVPGFELSRGFAGYYGIGVRGVRDSRTTSKLLIMIDGTPFNQILYGNYVDWGYDINLDAIEKIEIIRGPGSALYGRNAFSAVINIITKRGKMNDEVFLKGSLGTFNTKFLSGYYGFKKNKLDGFFSVRKIYSDVADSKDYNDFGQLAQWNIYKDNLWMNGKIGIGKFIISGMYLNLSGGGTLNDGKISNEIGNYSIYYQNALNPRADFNFKFFGHNSKYSEDFEQLKPNVDIPIPTALGGNGIVKYKDIYPLGIYFKPQSKEYMYGIESEVKYELFNKNNLLIGIQADLHGVQNVHLTSNVDMVTFAPIPGIGRNNLVKYEPGWFEDENHDYHNIALFLQDVWYPVENIGITLGGRYDYDSEIGKVINPRVGLLFMPIDNGNIRFNYGRAYRAPSPTEQYATLGFAIGNKKLKPEIINTIELAFNYRHQKMTHLISLFRNKLTNMIYAAKLTVVDPNNKYYNIGENVSTGIEYENKLIIGKSFYSFINYSYTISNNTDSKLGKDTTFSHPDIAPHKLNLGVNYSFLEYYKLNANMFYRSEMPKFTILGTNTEVKDEIGNYAIINSTFQIDNLIKNIIIGISVYNILDTKYYSQDNEHLHQPPQPGRQFIASITYNLK